MRMNKFPPRRILAAADLSGPSLSALTAAKALAQQWDAKLEVVHVRRPPLLVAPIGPDAIPVGPVLPPPESRRRVDAALRRALAGFPPERLRLRTVQGWPPSVLLELAKPRSADLMIMGTHGYAGLDRLLTGSVAEAVIRRSGIPVLAVPERKDVREIARVLAPWNGSPYATRALRWARDLARDLGATLDVLRVKEPATAHESDEKLEKQLVALLGAGAGWTLRTRKGDARAAIVAEANSGRYELAVLSAHRRPFGADLVLGSTVERLIRHAEIPVLAVPSGMTRPHPARRLAARAAARLY